MKKLKYIVMGLAATAVASCSLDETNYSTIDTEVAYTSLTGYQGLINACYENIYYLYGKTDGIGPMEMGTDLWKIGSRDGGNGESLPITTATLPRRPVCCVLAGTLCTPR